MLSHLSKMCLLCPRTSDLAKLLGTAFKKITKPQSLFHSNAHMLAAVRTPLGTSSSPPQSSETPALLAHVQQLEVLAHCSASLTSLIRFRPSRPSRIYCDRLSQQSLCASEIRKILINSGLALWQYNRLLCWRLRLAEGHENQGWAAGANRSFWATENFWTLSKSDVLPMGIQQSLRPGKLAYKWRACPAATSASWGNLCMNGRAAQCQRGGWAAPQRAFPTCLKHQGACAAHPCPCLWKTCHWR